MINKVLQDLEKINKNKIFLWLLFLIGICFYLVFGADISILLVVMLSILTFRLSQETVIFLAVSSLILTVIFYNLSYQNLAEYSSVSFYFFLVGTVCISLYGLIKGVGGEPAERLKKKLENFKIPALPYNQNDRKINQYIVNPEDYSYVLIDFAVLLIAIGGNIILFYFAKRLAVYDWIQLNTYYNLPTGLVFETYWKGFLNLVSLKEISGIAMEQIFLILLFSSSLIGTLDVLKTFVGTHKYNNESFIDDYESGQMVSSRDYKRINVRLSNITNLTLFTFAVLYTYNPLTFELLSTGQLATLFGHLLFFPVTIYALLQVNALNQGRRNLTRSGVLAEIGLLVLTFINPIYGGISLIVLIFCTNCLYFYYFLQKGRKQKFFNLATPFIIIFPAFAYLIYAAIRNQREDINLLLNSESPDLQEIVKGSLFSDLVPVFLKNPIENFIPYLPDFIPYFASLYNTVIFFIIFLILFLGSVFAIKSKKLDLNKPSIRKYLFILGVFFILAIISLILLTYTENNLGFVERATFYSIFLTSIVLIVPGLMNYLAKPAALVVEMLIIYLAISGLILFIPLSSNYPQLTKVDLLEEVSSLCRDEQTVVYFPFEPYIKSTFSRSVIKNPTRQAMDCNVIYPDPKEYQKKGDLLVVADPSENPTEHDFNEFWVNLNLSAEQTKVEENLTKLLTKYQVGYLIIDEQSEDKTRFLSRILRDNYGEPVAEDGTMKVYELSQ